MTATQRGALLRKLGDLITRDAAKLAAVEVRDNGVGFDPDASPGRGHGLRNLRQRAAQLGARLTLTSSPAGTSVTLLLPN